MGIQSDRLTDLLDRGLFTENLHEIIGALRVEAAEVPLPAYVLQCILGDLIEWWQDRPVFHSERVRVERMLMTPIRKVLGGIAGGAGPSEQFDLLNGLILAWTGYLTEVQRPKTKKAYEAR